eukprot:55748-Eustigmatos_ZCMA.PRE.1
MLVGRPVCLDIPRLQSFLNVTYTQTIAEIIAMIGLTRKVVAEVFSAGKVENLGRVGHNEALYLSASIRSSPPRSAGWRRFPF